MRTLYPWTRYWIRRGESVLLDANGHLVDPETQFLLNRKLVTWEQMNSHPCLILLGEPGSGKSTALESAQLTTPAPERLYLNLRGYGDQKLLHEQLFGSQVFSNWKRSKSVLELVLDSLDECLIHIRPLGQWIADNLIDCPVDRLRLRLTCRTAEWPRVLEETVWKLWDQSTAAFYELAPLRRQDIKLAAEQDGFDPDHFMTEVAKVGAGPLAASPNTLQFLLGEYASSKSLPADPIELYKRGCLRLAAENPSRSAAPGAEPIPAKTRIVVAERLAACMMFCQKGSLSLWPTSDAVSQDVLTASDVVGLEVIAGNGMEISEKMVTEVGQSGLFNGRAPGQVGFAHWTYGEFLAARFCITRRLSLDQLCDLIFHPEATGRPQVVPQLAEIAAWVSGMNQEFLEKVALHDPAVLLRSSNINMGPAARAVTARALLQLADSSDFFDTMEELRRVRFDVLNHPTLHEQLQPFIQDPTKNQVVRRIAIGIAEECRLEQLSSILADRALDPSESAHIRQYAAHAVAQIGEAGSCARLYPLLNLPKDQDSDDQLKGNALRALWPKHLDAKSLFNELTPPRRGNLLGAYAAFISFELPTELKPQDLPVALDWAERAPNEIKAWHHTRDLIAEITLLAFTNIDFPGVRDRFVRLALQRLDAYERVYQRDLSDTPDPFQEIQNRRDLVRILVPGFGERIGTSWLLPTDRLGLVRTDLTWMLDELMQSTIEIHKTVWASLALSVFDDKDRSQLDQVLEVAKHEPALAAQVNQYWGPVELESERATLMKKYWTEARDRKQSLAPKFTHDPIPKLVTYQLEKFEAGDSDAWWNLHLNLALHPERDTYQQHYLDVDLTHFSGWPTLDEGLRERCVDAGLKYLEIGDPDDEKWLGTSNIYPPAIAGYRAFRLLQDRRPEALGKLAPAVWAKWAGTILGFPASYGTSEDSGKSALVCAAYSNAPESVLAAAGKLVEPENRNRLFFLRLFENCWDRGLTEWLLELVQAEGLLSQDSIDEAFRHMFSHTPDLAVSPAFGVINGRAGSEWRQTRAVAVAIQLISNLVRQAWGRLWPIFQADENFGRAVTTGLAAHHRQEEAHVAGVLNEDELADFYIWIRKQFPPSPRTPDESGSYLANPLHQIEDFRDSLISRLRERGTKAAVKAVRRIVAEWPQDDWLKYVSILAERARLRQEWISLIPNTLFALARDRQARPLESPEQLLRAIIGSLKRLEQKLHGPTPAVVDLWEKGLPRDEKAICDYVKRHLQEDLQPLGIITHREAEVRRGQETDIYVDAIAQVAGTARNSRLSVVIEGKGCWNKDLKTSLTGQLKGRYLREYPGASGLYLVFWFPCDSWRDDWRAKCSPNWTLTEARNFFDTQASSASDESLKIAAFVLDVALRES